MLIVKFNKKIALFVLMYSYLFVVIYFANGQMLCTY